MECIVLFETAKGTPTIGTLVNLFVSQTTLQHYSTYINFNNLTSGDSFQITIYINDPNTPAERIYDQFTVTNAQSEPSIFTPFLPTDSYRVTAEKLTGTDSIIDWVLYTSI